MSDWMSVVIAALALLLSGYTWWSQSRRQNRADKQAHVTVSFHWLHNLARVVIAGREYRAGYHLVLANRGPAAAHDVDVQVADSEGRALALLDVVPGELPLRVLDADGRYPIPWIYEPFSRDARRFEALLSWTDDLGRHEQQVPLRRGQLP